MVKLDVSLMRFMEEEDFRVLVALEMTMRNHEVAPTALIEHIARLAHGGVKKRLRNLLKHKLIHHENTAYDGYRMKYGAYDLLAFKTFSKRGTVAGVGTRIGCGKESDIILVEDEHGQEAVVKLQRLGRCSFRSVARNRDYKNGKARRGESWFFLSRLAAQKEFAFMKMLYDEGFPVPKPLDQNRHAVVMEYLDAVLLNNIQEMPEAQMVYERCLKLVVKLAEHGLIHGDFNEFNIMVVEGSLKVMMIDFPQMVSTDHLNASDLFDRDVHNLADFFMRRFRIPTPYYPKLDKDIKRTANLDQVAMASGFFNKAQQAELDELLKEEAAENSDEEDEETDDSEEEQEEVKRGKKVVIPKSIKDDGIRTDNNVDEVDSSSSASDAEEEKEDDTPEPEGANESSAAAAATAKPEEEHVPVKPKKIKVVQRTRNGIQTSIIYTSKKNETGENESEVKIKSNADIDMEEILLKVKRMGEKAVEGDFNKGLHRNVQKGHHKSRVKRQLQQHKDGGDYF